LSVAVQVEIVVHPSLCSSPERLEALLAKIADFRPILQDVGGAVEEGIAAWFTSQGEGTWAALAHSTVLDRFRKGYGPNNELVRTGKLLAALTEHDAPGHKFLVSANSVQVGAYGEAVQYMGWLADGTPRMPGRILVQLTPGTMERILQLILDWLGGPDGVTVTAGFPQFS